MRYMMMIPGYDKVELVELNKIKDILDDALNVI